MGRKTNDLPLPYATLRISRLIQDGQDVANRLEQIAFDGVIDAAERDDFARVLAFLQQLEESINDIILIGLEKREAAPARTETTSDN